MNALHLYYVLISFVTTIGLVLISLSVIFKGRDKKISEIMFELFIILIKIGLIISAIMLFYLVYKNGIIRQT